MVGISPYDLNLRHLGAASTIGRSGNISAAANLENMSQSALTQAVSNLETMLNEQLFDRQPSGTYMTQAGKFFFQRTDQAIAFIKEGALSARRVGRANGLGNIMHRVTASQLRAAIAVDRAENFTGAAATTNLAQPTIHRAVRQLEHGLGIKIFEVSGKTVRATAAGKIFVRFARLAVVELEAALDEIVALHSPFWGRIVVGSLPLARAALLPAALARFSRENPAASAMVLEGSYPAMLEALRHGEIDILLGALRDPAPAPDVVQTPLFSTGLYMVANATHPLAKIGKPSVAQLARYPWVISHAGAPMRDKWERFMNAARVPRPERIIECGSVVVIRGLLLEDEFLTLLSEDQFKFEEANGMLTRIGPPLPGSSRQIGLTHRLGWRPTGLQERFIQCLHEVAAQRRPEGQVSGQKPSRKSSKG
jgi:LysR family transcriptional regulator of gallate degradation